MAYLHRAGVLPQVSRHSRNKKVDTVGVIKVLMIAGSIKYYLKGAPTLQATVTYGFAKFSKKKPHAIE